VSIAALIRRMTDAGAPPEAIAIAVEEIEALQMSLDARRAADRDRKRAQRERQKEANVTGQSEDSHGTVTDLPSPLNPPPKKAPDPKNTPPLISPQPEDLSAEPTAKPLTKSEVIEAWQTRMVPQGFPAIRKITGQRDRQLSARLKDSTLDEWLDAMAALERSAFCRGENPRGWRADFDFLLQPKSFTKLLEGAYDY
jgi:hypothetical protein